MQEQPEDLSEPSRNQSIDKPGPQESINMDGKSQETMNMHYNLIYTMATTNGKKLLIWKLSKSKNTKCSKILEKLSMKRTRSPMHQKGTKRSEYTLYLMSNIVENSRLDLLQIDRILTYGTLLDVLWQMYHPWITYGTVRRIV